MANNVLLFHMRDEIGGLREGQRVAEATRKLQRGRAIRSEGDEIGLESIFVIVERNLLAKRRPSVRRCSGISHVADFRRFLLRWSDGIQRRGIVVKIRNIRRLAIRLARFAVEFALTQ